MINLAGRLDADEHIRRELERCRIPILEVEPDRGEVPYTLMGQLCDIEFRRRWYYWAAKGPVPLAIAQALYADPVGGDIRVNGDAGSPEPDTYGHHYIGILPDGKQVLPLRLQAEWQRCADQFPSMRKDFEQLVFSDEPEAIGATLCVMSYHIDSELGLRLFADAISAHIQAFV